MTTECVSDQHIEITPDIAGGEPRIAGHRITVQNIVVWHERMGLRPDEIAATCGLALADIYAALTYHYVRLPEIDASIHAGETFIAKVRRATPPKLRRRLLGED